MRLPSNWSEVTIEQYIRLHELQPLSRENLFKYHVERLHVLSEEEIVDYELDVDDILLLNKRLQWMKLTPGNNQEEYVDAYKFIGFENLEVQEFIDLEAYFLEDYVQKMPEIIAIMYRKYKVDEWGQQVYQKFSDMDIKQASESVLSLPVGRVYGAITAFLKLREEVVEGHPHIFQPRDADEYDDLIQEDDEDELTQEEQDEEQIDKTFGWALFVYELCKGDMTRLNEALSMNLHIALSMITMKRVLKLK